MLIVNIKYHTHDVPTFYLIHCDAEKHIVTLFSYFMFISHHKQTDKYLDASLKKNVLSLGNPSRKI